MREVRLLVDADVMIKLAVLDCFVECVTALGYKFAECATMRSMTESAGRHNAAVREKRAGGRGPAKRLFSLLTSIPTIDSMTGPEKALSVAIATVSQAQGLFVHGGEAMLLSVAIHRGLPFLTTGDKKAVRSLPNLCNHIAAVAAMKGKLLPFEYLLLNAVQKRGLAALSARLHAGSQCDKGLLGALQRCGGDQGTFEGELTKELAKLHLAAPGYIGP